MDEVLKNKNYVYYSPKIFFYVCMFGWGKFQNLLKFCELASWNFLFLKINSAWNFTEIFFFFVGKSLEIDFTKYFTSTSPHHCEYTHIPDSVLTHHLIDQSHGKKGQKRLRTDGDQLFPMMLAILAAFFLIFHLGWQIGVGLRGLSSGSSIVF